VSPSRASAWRQRPQDEPTSTPAIDRASPEARAALVHALATIALDHALAAIEAEDRAAENANEPECAFEDAPDRHRARQPEQKRSTPSASAFSKTHPISEIER
jgi:hypothetical protein